MESIYKQVIVVRKDLNMRKGKLAAQVAHASVGSLTQFSYKGEEREEAVHIYVPHTSPMYGWLKGKFVKIVVSCDTEEQLFEIKYNAEKLKIQTVLITDAGLTEFHGIPTNTCLAVGPDEESLIDQVTKDLKLL